MIWNKVRLVMVSLITSLLFISEVYASEKIDPPSPNTAAILDDVYSAVKTYYPDFDGDWRMFLAQIEQETCTSLKSKTCMSPEARLYVRCVEEGVGLGQSTRAYDKQCHIRFDILTELTVKYRPIIGSMNWDNWRTKQKEQAIAFALFMRDNCKSIKNTATATDLFAMCLSAYNGGLGGLASDRIVCKATAGCDPSRWFGHVEFTSNKTRVPKPGYKLSAFEINRGYPRQVIKERYPRYQKYIDPRS